MTMGTAVLVLASLSSAPAAAVSSAPDEPANLNELNRTWVRNAPGKVSSSGTRAEALAALAAGRRAERCATPLLVALHQQSFRLNQPTRAMLDKATSAATASFPLMHPSPGGEFLIHYTIDRSSADRVSPSDHDGNGVPDGVERLAAGLSDVLADFIHRLEWGPPPSALPGVPSPPVHVYLVGLSTEATGGARLTGFTRPMPGLREKPSPNEEPAEASAAVVYFDASLASPEPLDRAAITHQIAHLVQMSESVRESPWWHESSATWIENHLEENATATAGWLRVGGARRGRGIDQPSIGLSLEAYLWPHYLVQSMGNDASLVRILWEEMAAVPGNNTLEAMDRVLRRRDSSLADEIRVFNIWNVFLGAADDGRHYPFAALLPTSSEDAVYDSFPARGGSLAGPLPRLGSSMVRLLGDGSQGGLRIRFQGVAPGAWDVALLVYPASRPADVRYVPVEVDASGRSEVSLPWRNLAAIDLVMQNLSGSGAPADYHYAIDYDPVVPFDLLSFTAQPSERGTVLSWSTEREDRLAGWNVYRGNSPLGPFTRVNQYLLPGGGDGRRSMSYNFADDSARAGQKYYYYLEGVTFEGFTESTHAAGVRLSAAKH